MKIFFELTSIYIQDPWGVWSLLMILILVLGLFFWRLKTWYELWPSVNKEEALKSKKPFSGRLEKQFVTILIVLSTSALGWLNAELIGLLFGSLVGLVLSFIYCKQRQQQQQRQISTQLPLFLRALGSTLKAGYSVPQALEFVALEVQNPLRKTLQGGVGALRWQQPLELVLADWRQQIEVPEFHFLTDSLLLQSKSGGNLVELCHRVAFLLEERAKLERDIKSFTAQGKMSGLLMAGLWPVSLALFAWLSPSHTDVLFKTPAGNILLGISFFLALTGFYFMWRLVRLKI